MRLPGPTHPHICETNRTTGKFTVHRKTIGKRMAAKLKAIRAQLRERMHDGVAGTASWLAQVVRGYFRYYAVPGNWTRMAAFRREVARLWFRALARRSQRRRLNWERFTASLGALLPPVEILHAYPNARFFVRHPHIQGRNRVRQ